jgi:hypothetical protein
VGEGLNDGHRYQYSGVIGCVIATRAAFAGRVSVSLMVSAAKEGERGTCSRIIKVDHAGEFGAVNIYRAQLMVARLAMPSLVAQLEEFIAHENRHLNTFAEVLRARASEHSGLAMSATRTVEHRSSIAAGQFDTTTAEQPARP